MPLDPAVRQFATDPNFAALTTLFPDGRPQTQIVWVDADDDHLLVNTEVHRAKFTNVEHDPRVTVTIWDHDDPYRFVEVRGRVGDVVRGPRAREHIDELAQRHWGRPYDHRNVMTERAILRIVPQETIKRKID